MFWEGRFYTSRGLYLTWLDSLSDEAGSLALQYRKTMSMLSGTCQTVGPYQVWSKDSWIDTHQLTCAYPEIHVRTHTVTEICTHVQPNLIYAHSAGKLAFAHMAVIQANTCMRSHAGIPLLMVWLKCPDPSSFRLSLPICFLCSLSLFSPYFLSSSRLLFPLLPYPLLFSAALTTYPALSLPPTLLALPSSPYLLSSSAAVQTVMMSYVQSAQGWETHQSVHTDRLYIWFVFCVTAPCTGTHWERERER